MAKAPAHARRGHTFSADHVAATRRLWAAWAASQAPGWAPPAQERAVEAAMTLLLAGAGAAAAAAGGRIAARGPDQADLRVLHEELAFARALIAELNTSRTGGGLTAAGIAELKRRQQGRLEAIEAMILSAATPPPAAAVTGPAPASPVASPPPAVLPPSPASKPKAKPAPPVVPRPSLREFVDANSILLLSYAGAFLLVVATVLFELYAVGGLGGGVRFAGVLALDLVFGLAGWACLRSRRLRLVGHTYVAVFALIAPLVFVAGYVFLGLRASGISVDEALLLTGGACALLYAALGVRLRSEAYGLMALIALPVAWLGGLDAAGLTAWRGPGFALLVAVYALLARRGSNVFGRHASWFVHGAAAVAIGLGTYQLGHQGGWVPWLAASGLALIGAGYGLSRALGGDRSGSWLGQTAVLLAAAAAAGDAGLGSLRGTALVLLMLAFTVLARRASALAISARFASEARWFVHAAAAVALILSLYDGAGSGWLPWRLALTVGAVAGAYLFDALLGAGIESALLALVALAFAWPMACTDLGLGAWRGPATAPLVAVYALSRLPVAKRFRLGELLARYSEPCALAAGLTAVALTGFDSTSLGGLFSWRSAAAAALVTAGWVGLAVLGGGRLTAVAARTMFGITWLLVVHDLSAGAWRGPIDTALVTVYAAAGHGRLRAGRLTDLLSAQRGWMVHGAAAVSLALTWAQGGPVSWRAAVAYAGLAIGYLVFTRLAGGLPAAALGLLFAGAAWGVADVRLVPDQVPYAWAGAMLLPLAAAYTTVRFRASRLGPAWAALERVAEPFVHVAAAASLLSTAVLTAAYTDSWPGPAVPALLAGVASVYVLYRLLSGRPLALLATAILGSLATLAESQHLGLGSRGWAVLLPLLATTWWVGSLRTGHAQLRAGLLVGMAIQALLPLLLADVTPTVEAAVLSASAALFVIAAWRADRPWWLLGAGLTAAGAWYWAPQAFGASAIGDVAALADRMVGLPAAFGLVALGLRGGLGRRWATPAYLLGAAAAGLVPLLALGGQDLALAGYSLLAYAAIAYAVASVESWPGGALVASLAAAAGIVFALAAASAQAIWYPVAVGLLSLVIYLGQFAWEGRHATASDWMAVHRFAGLAGAAVTAVSGFTLPQYTQAATLGALLAGVAVLVFAAMLVVDGRRYGLAAMDYGAAMAASLSSFFAARWLGASDPQLYVVAPGLALIGCGLRLPHDARLTRGRQAGTWLVAAGATLLLGTTALQSLSVAAWLYTTVLVFEGVAALVAGIGTRNRTLVVAGGAAVGVAAIRALTVLVQSGLLFVAFGAVAIILLALGAVLALLRDQVDDARHGFSTAWHDWS